MFVRNGSARRPDAPPGPPGCTPLRDDDRMPVLRVVSGDTWTVDAEIASASGAPATPRNSVVEFVVAENQFSPPIWTGGWVNGVLPDKNVPWLVHVRIPRDVTKTLRRGSYMFSLRVGDVMGYEFSTQLNGHFLVEYAPTSDQHSIPYRDGTSERFSSSWSGTSESATESAHTDGSDAGGCGELAVKKAMKGQSVSVGTIADIRESVLAIARTLGAEVDGAAGGA